MESVDSVLNTRLLLVFACTFLLLFWLLRWRSKYSNMPPGPWHIPPVGSPQFFSSTMHLEFTKLGQKYGGIYTLHMGLSPIVVLSDLFAIKEALVKTADEFSDRFVLPFGKKTFKKEGSILFSNGTPWSTRRRVALSALRSFGMGKKSLEGRVIEEARYLCDAMDRYNGAPFDPDHIVKNAISNIICTISYGQRYDYNDPVFESLLTNLDTIFRASPMTTILWGLPISRLFSRFRAMTESFEKVSNFSKKMVESHRLTFDPDNIRDVIDSFILEGDKHQDAHDDLRDVFRDDLIWRAIHDLFGAGTDTTTYTLLWLIILMMKFPDVQKQVQQEVDDVIGDGRAPMIDDRVRMPYTEATIMEVQRFRTVAPYVPPRAVRSDVHIMGYTLPKGTQIWVNLWGALNDPAHWSNPESFDPCRFLSDDGQHVITPEAFIPFGTGKRSCIGEQLAKMELFIFFTSMMQRFTFTSDGTTTLDLNGKIGLTLIPNSYKTIALRR